MTTRDAPVFEFGYLVYDTLFFQDWRTGTHSVTGEIEPNLVETWELANDGRTYTFTLVEGIKFHDGTDFDATDVKASMEFYADPGDVAPPGGSLVGPNKPVTTIVDSHTVTIAIAEPSPIFLTPVQFQLGAHVRQRRHRPGPGLSQQQRQRHRPVHLQQ